MKQVLKDSLVWGFILWLIGYVLGFIFFFILPPQAVGWAIFPIGTIITLWVLLKKIKSDNLKYYLILSVVWTMIAIVLDYFFIVKMLNSKDYYKLDVYLYYFLIFFLPLFVGYRKQNKINK